MDQTVLLQSGHYQQSLGSSLAASQGTILGQLLQDRPLLRAGEVLELVPAVVVTQHSGDGKANQYFLRGYNLDHGTDFATSINGVPVNMASNAHGQGYTDLNYLIPELVDHIDYQKGNYFSRNGDFSSAGAAQIAYRSVLEHSLFSVTAGQENYRRLFAVGSLELQNQTESGLHQAAPNLLGAIEILGENGPWNPPEHARKYNGFVRLSSGDASAGWTIDGTFYQSQWNAVDQVPLDLIESGQLGRYAALDNSDGGNTGRYILSGEFHQRDASGYSKVQAYLQHYRLQLWSNFTFYEFKPQTGDQFEQWESRNLLGGEWIKGWNHALFGHESVTELGIQLRHDQTHVGLFNSKDRVVQDTVNDNRISETRSAMYLQNSTDWSSWLHSSLGIRADFLNQRQQAIDIATNSGSASAHQFSPKLALVFGPWQQTEFFVNAGKGFHSNDTRGVINRIDPTTGSAASPVPALASSIGKEIGLRTEWLPGLQSSLALWSLNSDSELVYSADSATGSTSPNAASKRYGVEWNNHMVVSPNVLFDADFAWTRARYAAINANDQSGDQIPNAVARVASVALTIKHLGPWLAELNSRYIGSYPLSQDGVLRSPSAIVSNFRLQRDLTPKLSLALNVLNLFNRSYFDIAYEQDYRLSPTSAIIPNGVTVHPGEPREFRLTLNYQL